MADFENARQRVIKLAQEVEQLSRMSIPPDRFFAEFLKRIVDAVAAPAGAIWMLEGQAPKLVSEVRLNDTGLPSSAQAQQTNHRILINVLQTGESGTFDPEAEGELASPTEQLVIVAALHLDKNVVGIVELFQRPDTPHEARPGYLQFLEQMCGHASRYLDQRKSTQQPAQAGGVDPFWKKLEDVTLQLQRSLNPDEVASVATNDGKLLLDCDRLSLAIRRGRKTTIRAISGQDSVNPRANLVRSMRGLAENVIRMGETLTYTGQLENLAPQIEVPLADYVQESGSRLVLVIPLFDTPALVRDEEDEDTGAAPDSVREAYGCLIIEQISDSEPKPGLSRNAEMLSEHVSAATFNALKHQRIPFLKTLTTAGKTLDWFHGRKLAKTLVVLGIVAAIIGSMLFVPWDYRVNGEGLLMPVTQKEVFAPWDGRVEDLKVKSGDRVTAGDTLVVLRNKQLESELTTARSRVAEISEQIEGLRAQIDDDAARREESELTELFGQLHKAQVELLGAKEQEVILTERVTALTVTAPISGVVATFQLDKRVQNRPIMRGEVLLEIMDDTSDQWRLELQLEEHRMGHVLKNLEPEDAAGASAEPESHGLVVEYRLATDPEVTYSGTLARDDISTRALKSEELGNVVPVFVGIEEGEPIDRRIGAEVQAKIYCGKRSLGYVLFGDAIEFVQKFFWL